jgi:hypothetical protein
MGLKIYEKASNFKELLAFLFAKKKQ